MKLKNIDHIFLIKDCSSNSEANSKFQDILYEYFKEDYDSYTTLVYIDQEFTDESLITLYSSSKEDVDKNEKFIENNLNTNAYRAIDIPNSITHFQIWKRIIENNFQNVLILEDHHRNTNLTFENTSNSFFSLNRLLLYGLPSDYSIISLDSGENNVHADMYGHALQKSAYDSNVYYKIRAGHMRSMSSYVISHKCCKHFIKNVIAKNNKWTTDVQKMIDIYGKTNTISSYFTMNMYWAEPIIFDTKSVDNNCIVEDTQHGRRVMLKNITIVLLNFPFNDYVQNKKSAADGADYYAFFKKLFKRLGYNMIIGKSNKCDVLIGSVFGDVSTANRYDSDIKIFFTGEARQRYKFNEAMKYYSHYIGFDDPKDNNNVFRVPYWMWCFHDYSDVNSQAIQMMKQQSSVEINNNETYLKLDCTLVARTDFSKIRTLICKLLQDRNIKVDCPSDVCNNTISIVYDTDNYFDDKICHLRKYKFEICFENTYEEGYITEKIFGALYAGCIPIYWGSEFKDYIEGHIINEDRIIRLNRDLSNVDYVIDTVCKLIQNESYFHEFTSKPIFHQSAWDKTYEYMRQFTEWVGDIVNTHTNIPFVEFMVKTQNSNNDVDVSMNENDIITEDGLVDWLEDNTKTLFLTRKKYNAVNHIIENADIVCLTGYPEILNYFFEKIFPKMKKPFKLITIESDKIVLPKEIVEHPNIIHWYTWNKPYHHDKISCLPIGLNRDRHLGSIRQYLKNKNTRDGDPPPQDKLLINFDVSSNGQRAAIGSLVQSQLGDICEVKTYENDNTSHNAYLTSSYTDKRLVVNPTSPGYYSMISNYRYVLSPYGAGYDCHRTWECLYLGIIPIIQTSTIDEIFDDLPVIKVNTWKDLDNSTMGKKIEELQNTSGFNYEKLKLSYWTDFILSN